MALLPQADCRLLCLPAEIRNEIIKLAVTEEDTVFAVGPTLRLDKEASPALARTCRQLRREIIPIFYGANILEFDSSAVRSFTLKCWRDRVDDYYTADSPNNIRSIVIRDHFRLYELDLSGITLAYDAKDRIKVSYLGPPDAREICTCHVEKEADELVGEGWIRPEGALFFFMLYLCESVVWTWLHQDGPPQDRTEQCVCGVPEKQWKLVN